MEASAMRSGWTFAQKGVLVFAGLLMAWSLAGLIANPDFSTGADAPTERILGVDFNGWHAVSGFLLFAPAFVAVLRPAWALTYALAAGGALVATGLWVAVDTEPLFILHLPNNASDAVFHIAFGLLFLAIAAVQLNRDRAAG
jgi:uncharacterized protein DUF4383